MGYRTQCELKVKEEDEVEVKPSKWFIYYWNNSDSYYKYPFRIAFYAAVFTLLSFLLGLASFIMEVFKCCQ